MAIIDQVTLRTGVADWLNRSDLTDAQLDDFMVSYEHYSFSGVGAGAGIGEGGMSALSITWKKVTQKSRKTANNVYNVNIECD